MALTRTTTNGYQFLIDEQDAEFVDSRSWFAQGRPGYVYVATILKIENTRKIKYLHRLLFNLTDKKVFIDHKNHNTLDNTRGNLRISNNRLNQVNRLKKPNCISKYIGITKTKNNTWTVKIRNHRKRIGLGVYKTEEAAALIYNKASIKINGDHASLNVFDISEQEIIDNENLKRKFRKLNGDFSAILQRLDSKIS